MAKNKKVGSKKARIKSPKYSKILIVAQKELESKKKALVSAERALAKAKEKHEELVAEVARLDMAERSLRSLVEGTEPPQNVRYVYNYPQWVWQPSIWTVPSYQGWNYTTCQNLPNTTVSNGNWQGQTTGVLTTNATAGTTAWASNSGSIGNTVTVNNASLSGGNCFTLTSGTPDANCVTIDLSTHAEAVEPEYMEATATVSNS